MWKAKVSNRSLGAVSPPPSLLSLLTRNRMLGGGTGAGCPEAQQARSEPPTPNPADSLSSMGFGSQGSVFGRNSLREGQVERQGKVLDNGCAWEAGGALGIPCPLHKVAR